MINSSLHSKIFCYSRPFFLCAAVLCLFLGLSDKSHAVVYGDIEVKIQEPTWQFLMGNQPTLQTEAQLLTSESNFARSIQPFLAAGDYEAVRIQFESRNIDDDSAALRQLRGQVMLSLKEYEAAEDALNAALQLMPDLALAHQSLSMLYMVDKRLVLARQHLTKSIELGVGDAQVYGQLAYINLQLGNAASAVAGYQYALFLEADNIQWKQGLLYALIKSQAFDQAQALLEEMLLADNRNADLWLQRGQIALNQDRPVQALSSLERALQLGDSNPENMTTVAQLHIQEGSPRRAVALLANNMSGFIGTDESGNESANESANRVERYDTIDQIASWLAYQKQWGNLNTLMQSVAKNRVKPSSVYLSRFDVYRSQIAIAAGEISNATSTLEKAITNDPVNGEALLTLAELLRGKNGSSSGANSGNISRAVTYYSRAEALPLYKERALLGRAQLEIDRQNYEEALQALRQVLRSDPTRADISVNIQSLENLLRNRS